MHILSFIFYRQNSCNSEAMLSNRYPLKQLWGQINEMTSAKSMWVILGWWIYHDSINHQLYPSSSVSLHRLKRWEEKRVSEVWIEWRVRYDGSSCGVMEMHYFGWYGELLFIPADWMRGREILIKWAISFFSSHIALSFHFLFYSSEKRHYGFLDSFN